MNLLRDILNSLIGITRIRVNGALGRYDERVGLDAPSEIWCNDLYSEVAGDVPSSS